MPSTRAPDFKLIYTNGFALKMTDHDLSLTFGVDQDPANSGQDIYEQMSVYMTHRTAKLLMLTLTRVISNFESAKGAIPMTDKQVAAVEKAVNEGTQVSGQKTSAAPVRPKKSS